MNSLALPTDPEAITAEWLTAVLGESGALASAIVKSLDWTLLRRGRLNRIVRIRPRDVPAGGTAPRSIIGKFYPQNAVLRELVAPMAAAETRFCRHIASESELRTPICYYDHHDIDSSAFVLLIEDLEFAQRGFEQDDCTPDDAELVIGQLGAFHATWWDHGEHNQATFLRPLKISEHAELQGPGLPEFLSPNLATSPQTQVSVEREYALVRDRLSRGPLTVILDDLHIGNLLCDLSGEKPSVTFIDFQFVCFARGPVDVTRLLAGSLTTEARRAVEMRMLSTYYDVLIDGGVTNYTYENCLRDYRLGLLWGLLRLTTNNPVMKAIAVDPRAGARTEPAR